MCVVYIHVCLYIHVWHTHEQVFMNVWVHVHVYGYQEFPHSVVYLIFGDRVSIKPRVLRYSYSL